jgi:hypothetical protein
VAQLARRVFARFIQPQAEHLKNRVTEIEAGKYDQMLDELSAMAKDDLKTLYVAREREPDMAAAGTWQPRDTSHL